MLLTLLIVQVAFGAFWLTHVHMTVIKMYNIKLPFAEWNYCYHCVSFWYAIILLLLHSVPFLLLILGVCGLAYFLSSMLEVLTYV